MPRQASAGEPPAAASGSGEPQACHVDLLVPEDRNGRSLARFMEGLPNPVPLEYSIEWLTCAVASKADAVMVG